MINRYSLCLLFLGSLLKASPLDDFASAIEADLNGRSVGYGYAIFQDGNFVRGGGGGSAKLGDPDNAFDTGIPFNENTVKDCHSVSKTITAVALFQALITAGVSIDAPMWTFLPSDLQSVLPPALGSPPPPNDVRRVTFRQLLSHTSGFSPSSSYSWAALKNQLAQDAETGMPVPVNDFRYSNWNYAVCRLLIPYLLRNDFYRSTETALAGTPDGGVAVLESATSADYINHVRNRVFALAGLDGISPRPEEFTTLPNFAWYYNYADLTVPGKIMPDRRLTVGSGGWALSARQYAQFISALFRGEIIATNNLNLFFLPQNLGMFARTSSDGNDTYYAHSGATTGNGVGGRSTWMAFPGDIQVAIQANAINTAYNGYGRDLDLIVQEAYENAFATPASLLSFPLHLFFHREQDGWINSRGIRNEGSLAARNFDYDFGRNGAPTGMIHHRFFSVGSKAFLLRYSPHSGSGGGSGRAVMHNVNANGTLGSEVFNHSNWLPGYTHVLTFATPNGTFLLLHNSATGRIRTLPVTAFGNLNAAVTDGTYTTGFNITEILTLSGIPHLLRHNSTTGHTHLRVLNANGSLGATTFDDTWSTGFTDWEIYQAGGNTFIFRYNPEAGAARINRVDGSLANVPEILNSTSWTKGWSSFRFFEIGSQAFFIRYNAVTGAVRMQQITTNGVPDNSNSGMVFRSDRWLMETVATSVFNPSRTGWTGMEIYDATPGFFTPPQGFAYEESPGIELGLLIASIPEPQNTGVITLEKETPTFRKVDRILELDWQGANDVLYFLEESDDLLRWSTLGVIEGEGLMITIPINQEDTSSSPSKSKFYRIHSMEAIPPLPHPTHAP